MSIPFWNTPNGREPTRESTTVYERFNVPWLRTVAICSTLLPSLLYVPNLNPIIQFSPRHIIYPRGYSLLSLLFTPWASPESFTGLISRVLQAGLFWQLPSFILPLTYAFWIFIGAFRTLLGLIFSRAVGWAYPRLFKHYALYETSSGFGPMLWAYCELTGCSDFSKFRIARLRSYLPIAIGALLCWLDNAPWTYSIAIVFAAAIRLITVLMEPSRRQDVTTSKASSLAQLRSLIYRTIISLALISSPYYLLPMISRPARVITLPSTPFPPSPFLEILILSFPRVNSLNILNTTISSYLPYVNNDVKLSAFTGAPDHVAFQQLQAELKGKDITFYVDQEKHPEAIQGQHLHLAEAFKWVGEKGPYPTEWIMLIEDDFPLCGGDVGWEAIVHVMEILENGRPRDNSVPGGKKGGVPTRRGGFVGTGGRFVISLRIFLLLTVKFHILAFSSGLIIHRTLLPTLIHVLRTYADRVSKIPPRVFRRPADLIVQDCLLGADPMCPPRRENGLVITSRLVMDHIGGLSSTNTQKLPNSDKWRCGWRHPFHGFPEVQVVPVEDLW